MQNSVAISRNVAFTISTSIMCRLQPSMGLARAWALLGFVWARNLLKNEHALREVLHEVCQKRQIIIKQYESFERPPSTAVQREAVVMFGLAFVRRDSNGPAILS